MKRYIFQSLNKLTRRNFSVIEGPIIRTPLTVAMGLMHPIILAPMGGVR